MLNLVNNVMLINRRSHICRSFCYRNDVIHLCRHIRSNFAMDEDSLKIDTPGTYSNGCGKSETEEVVRTLYRL